MTTEIIVKYFEAWKCANSEPEYASEILINIFAADSIYRVKPGQEEHVGINNIIRYWLNNPGQQLHSAPHIIDGFTNLEGDKYFCEFENKFEVNVNNSSRIKITRGMILFKFQPVHENEIKIIELREYYRSEILDRCQVIPESLC